MGEVSSTSMSGDKLAQDLRTHLDSFALGWYMATATHGSEEAQSFKMAPGEEVLRREAQRFVSEHPEHKESRYIVVVNTISEVVKEVGGE